MTAFQALVTAILQGITELFPVSSLGHAVVLPALLGWQIDQQSPSFLPFLVVLHLGTAAALLVYFWRDWIQLLLAVLGRPTERPRADELRLLGLIIIATPVIIGAAVLEVPKLLHHDAAAGGGFTGLAVVSGIVAGITAYLSIAFLMHYFKKHDFEALDPFAWYCWAFGAVSLALLLFVV